MRVLLIKSAILIMAVLCLSCVEVSAFTKGALELGLDGGFTYTTYADTGENFTSNDLTVITFPTPLIRVGYFLTEALELEPTFSFESINRDGNTDTLINMGVDLNYHLKLKKRGVLPFVQAGAGFFMIREKDEEFPCDPGSFCPKPDVKTRSQFGIGGGGGLLIPKSDRFHIRFTVTGNKFFETDDLNGNTNVVATIGFSFFTK